MGLSLTVVCPAMGPVSPAVRQSWLDTMSKPWDLHEYGATRGEDAGFLTKCERARHATNADVIAYFHSDLTIHEHRWDRRVLAAFADPNVAVVGFVGATGLGHENIYKVPYAYTQLARYDVWSNLTDAEVHGGRETGIRRVAVVDSCAVIVRRKFLDRLDGWPLASYPNTSHCSDLWVCCHSHRMGYLVRMVGIACTHASGGRGVAGTDWLNARGGDELLHRQAHRVLYEDMRGILPIRIAQP